MSLTEGKTRAMISNKKSTRKPICPPPAGKPLPPEMESGSPKERRKMWLERIQKYEWGLLVDREGFPRSSNKDLLWLEKKGIIKRMRKNVGGNCRRTFFVMAES